jgi:hypothetical protein
MIELELQESARGRADDTAALRTRLLIVEAALRCIEQEADRALARAEDGSDANALLDAVCRIAAIARQAARDAR